MGVVRVQNTRVLGDTASKCNEYKAIQSIQPLINEQMIDNQEIYDPIIISSDLSDDQAVAVNETETYVVQKVICYLNWRLILTLSAPLIAMNNFENPDVLYVGQKLTVPAGQVKNLRLRM